MALGIHLGKHKGIPLGKHKGMHTGRGLAEHLAHRIKTLHSRGGAAHLKQESIKGCCVPKKKALHFKHKF